MYNVRFYDSTVGNVEEDFDSYEAAQEYWDDYADTETCLFGRMIDLDNGEIIWQFDDREAE